MLVTEIESIDKKKDKIYIDGEFSFVLYKNETRRFAIEKDNDISEETYHTIINEVIKKRAKARSLYLLKASDRTESQLRMKLRQNLYKDDIIDAAIEYVKSYHYIDDERYVRNYVAYKGKSKSKREIEAGLLKKGVSREIINRIYEEQEIDEEELIRKIILKKGIDTRIATKEEIAKLYGFLVRKGFSSDKVLHEIKRDFE